MKRIFITGSTGNVGMALLESLFQRKNELQEFQVIAAVRKLDHNAKESKGFTSVLFDFNKLNDDLHEGDLVFLLRPPELADVNKTFLPFIELAVKAKVAHIVFISVQGVEKSSLIPHHGIEKLIISSKIPYTFLRNSYFMQNLSTTLLKDIKLKKEIFIPAGKAVFNWVDVNDIGAVAAEILINSIQHKNIAYEITGEENVNFKCVAEMMSSILKDKIIYTRPSLLRFYLVKRKEGISTGMILVMMFLHYIPNFVQAPKVTDSIRKILNRPPGKLSAFISKNASVFLVH